MLRHWIKAGRTAALAFALTAGGASGALAGPCSVSKVSIKGDFGELQFHIEIADTEAERAQGLMHRAEMAQMAGMLFVYERPQRVAFWMKNTLIPLDMLFVDERGKILRIHEKAIPGDLTTIPGGDNVFAVLEINGGLSKKFGLHPGAVLRHKSFPQNRAFWPC